MFAPTDVRLERSPTDVIAADLNGDGRIDLAAAVRISDDGHPDFEQGYAYVFAGKGDGTFNEPATYQVPNGTFRIVAGDFTRDGRVDLATLNDSFTFRDDCVGFGGADSVTILPGTGGGSFGPAASFALAGFQNSALSLNTSDLNRDGSTDLIVSNGTILFTKTPGANAPPTVNAGPDEIRIDDREVVLRATASDPDGDWLTYVWTLEDGSTIAHSNPCVSGLSDGPHTFTVTVDDGHGHETSDSVTYTVYSEPPPARPEAFVGRDIGSVGAAGHSSFDGMRFTVSASGADIWNGADAFQFTSQTLYGNFVLTVHVDSVQNVDRWTKAGLMIREDLGAGSRHASVFASAEKGVAFQRRPVANGASVSTAGPLTTAPLWLKLVRDGDVIPLLPPADDYRGVDADRPADAYRADRRRAGGTRGHQPRRSAAGDGGILQPLGRADAVVDAAHGRPRHRQRHRRRRAVHGQRLGRRHLEQLGRLPVRHHALARRRRGADRPRPEHREHARLGQSGRHVPAAAGARVDAGRSVRVARQRGGDAVPRRERRHERQRRDHPRGRAGMGAPDAARQQSGRLGVDRRDDVVGGRIAVDRLRRRPQRGARRDEPQRVYRSDRDVR